MTRADPRALLAEDVRRGLGQRPRSIPSKWFYDEVGSALFDEICELPEYYLTRSEHSILVRDADAIAEATGAAELFEIGSGMARKTGLLLAALARRVERPRYLPFDIADSALASCARAVRAVVPTVEVEPLRGDFERDLATLQLPHTSSRRLFAFLGSTIGNFDESAAPALLAQVRALMRPVDSFLLGVDLVKDTRVLEAAYDDAAGVTARFNKNVLAVINRELGGDFDLDRFVHRSRYDVPKARIEMYLEAEVAQRVRLRAIDVTVELERGERILTEISRKFTRETAEATLLRAGMIPRAFHVASDGSFALLLAGAGA